MVYRGAEGMCIEIVILYVKTVINKVLVKGIAVYI